MASVDWARPAAAFIRKKTNFQPRLGVILGSGFGGVSARIEPKCELSTARIPGLVPPSVGGHAGRVIFGLLGGKPVCVWSGRAHFYEGHTMEEITRPVRTMAALGVRKLLVTNAAGGLGRGWRRGDLMLIEDHINLMGANPLRGPLRNGRECFVDMTSAYDKRLSGFLRQAARRCGLRLRSGVYLAVSGPSYETPAEIRAFRVLGADAVGMSTVPEVIVARQHGMAVAGLSCITNLAAAIGNPLLSHADVLASGLEAGERAAAVIERFAECVD